MSILIKGLKMPKKGECIDIVIIDDGTVVCYDDDDKKIGEAVELPDHGDLIDRDAVLNESKCGEYWWETEEEVPKILNEIPTIIPAERSEE